MSERLIKKVFYTKEGDDFVPVAEYDSFLMKSFSAGAHLVICEPGFTIYKYNVDPNQAALIAAGMVAKNKMINAMLEKSSIQVRTGSINDPAVDAAHQQLISALGDKAYSLRWESADNIAQAGIDALQEEANKLMDNPAVRNAFEQFLTVCKLSK